MKLSENEIVVNPVCNDQRRIITALAVPKICSELENQSYRIAVEKYSFLQNLQLTNQAHLDNTIIDLLIGADTYWEFVTVFLLSLLPPTSQTLGHCRAITAESSPLHIASSRTRTGNLWLPSASC